MGAFEKRACFMLGVAIMMMFSGNGIFADDQCNTPSSHEEGASASDKTQTEYHGAGNYEFRGVEERAASANANELNDVPVAQEHVNKEGQNLSGLLGFFFRDQPQAAKSPQPVATDAGAKTTAPDPKPKSPIAPSPEPTGPQADFFKKRGYVWDGKSWVKQPEPRYEEIRDPSTGEIIGIKTLDGKTVKPGERGYKDAEKGLADQTTADADKAWSEQVSHVQNADEDASKAKTAEIRRARKAALEKMKDPDPNVQAQGRAEWEALK